MKSTIENISDISIHAPARGATYVSVFDCHVLYDFNPRAREGRDRYGNFLHYFNLLFQSTRPRGARRNGVNNHITNISISIHAPARGATAAFVAAVGLNVSFQSTRPRGARPTPNPLAFG